LQSDGHAFSFFTRNLARLAPSVLSLLETHGQAVDPNLRRLANAFNTVADKVGTDAISAALKGELAAAGKDSDSWQEDGMQSDGAADLEEGLQALRKEMMFHNKQVKGRKSGDKCAPKSVCFYVHLTPE
jgi:ATP-dependent RNA helicase DDX5/DBP2